MPTFLHEMCFNAFLSKLGLTWCWLSSENATNANESISEERNEQTYECMNVQVRASKPASRQMNKQIHSHIMQKSTSPTNVECNWRVFINYRQLEEKDEKYKMSNKRHWHYTQMSIVTTTVLPVIKFTWFKIITQTQRLMCAGAKCVHTAQTCIQNKW